MTNIADSSKEKPAVRRPDFKNQEFAQKNSMAELSVILSEDLQLIWRQLTLKISGTVFVETMKAWIFYERVLGIKLKFFLIATMRVASFNN